MSRKMQNQSFLPLWPISVIFGSGAFWGGCKNDKKWQKMTNLPKNLPKKYSTCPYDPPKWAWTPTGLARKFWFLPFVCHFAKNNLSQKPLPLAVGTEKTVSRAHCHTSYYSIRPICREQCKISHFCLYDPFQSFLAQERSEPPQVWQENSDFCHFVAILPKIIYLRKPGAACAPNFKL